MERLWVREVSCWRLTGERGRQVFMGKLSGAQVKGDPEDFIPWSGVWVEDRRG